MKLNKVKIQFKEEAVEKLSKSDYNVVVFNVFEESDIKNLIKPFIEESKGITFDAFKEKLSKFKGKLGETAYFNGINQNIFLFVGLGSSKPFKEIEGNLKCWKEKYPYIIDSYRRFVSSSILRLMKLEEQDAKILFVFSECYLKKYFDFIRNSIESIFIGGYTFDLFKSKKDNDPKAIPNNANNIERIDFCFLSNTYKNITHEMSQDINKSIQLGYVIGESINLCRDLIIMPSNYCTPSLFVKKIREEAEKTSLSIDVLDKHAIEKLKMEAFLAVSKGSIEEPKFLIMRHQPKEKVWKKSLALVGKGITFDSGGISLKPSLNMHEMKGDMSGAAVVAATLLAISKLNLPIEVKAYIPLCENMPSGSSVKPGDVVKAMNGKTIEILNTDAEGRLILADALFYASQVEENNQYIIDLATLTGAIVVSLGEVTTGLFSNSSVFTQKFLQASYLSGEKLWQLPLFKEYFDLIKGSVADLSNIGKSGAGASSITAAAFLQNFIGDNIEWIHLDIAGTNWMNDQQKFPLYPSNTPTGVMISTLINYVLDLSNMLSKVDNSI